MKRKFKISIASAEMVPFAKVGGLGDVVGSLSKKLATMGHEVRVFLPRYGSIKAKEHGLRKVRLPEGMSLNIGGVEGEILLWQSRAKGSSAKVYFVGNDHLFSREGIYGDPVTHEDYQDNGLRFTFFCKAILELHKALGLETDVLHCNDHQTALIPLLLRRDYSGEPTLSNAGTLFTIHNMGYQGVYPLDILEQTGLPEDLAYPMGPLEFWGKLNFMKSAIVYSDVISTVSETYAKEIQSGEEFGFGLEGSLKARSEDLFGVLNGVDYTAWNPARDRHIPHKYSASDWGGKLKNKLYLIEKEKLTQLSEKSFLLGVVSRLADQKGFDLLQSIVEEMLSKDLGLVLLGAGQQKYHEYFLALRSKYPGKVSVSLKFSEKLAHLIEAASDAFLMPSKYEPCGLNQMYSMKYGSIPIVRYTGGLADTVEEFEPASGSGTGFVFHGYTPAALMEAVTRAYDTYQDKQQWSRLVKNAMEADFSWRRSAQGYVELYKRAIERKTSGPFASWVDALAEGAVGR
ncbi:MAG: glycogen synthase [Candidatus Eiseniibacteriota bacterium]|nr:MAG: glycogen synthase [Candidatus Eisenbacteria bacterium]